jgi:DNA-binding GntR family transcriptional regulator
MIDARTLRQQIYEELKERIIQGRLTPGETLSLRKLASEYGVSFMPVREAVWQLASEGILTVESNKRIRVSRLTPEELREILDIRLLLEGEAVKRACEKADLSCAAKAQAAYEYMMRALENPGEYTTANMQFHFSIYEGSDSPILLEMIRKLWARVGPYFSIHAAAQEIVHEAQENHTRMMQAYSAFDVSGVMEALRKDLTETAEFLIPRLKIEEVPYE